MINANQADGENNNKQILKKIEFETFIKDYAVSIDRRVDKVADQFNLTREGRKDLKQEIKIKLWNEFDKIKASNHKGGYVLRITENKCIDLCKKELKKNKLKTFVSEDGFDVSLDYNSFSTYSKDIESAQKEAKIREVISIVCSPQMAEIIYAKNILNKSYEELSNKYNISVNNLKSQIRRDLIKIREYIKTESISI